MVEMKGRRQTDTGIWRWASYPILLYCNSCRICTVRHPEIYLKKIFVSVLSKNFNIVSVLGRDSGYTVRGLYLTVPDINKNDFQEKFAGYGIDRFQNLPTNQRDN